MGPDEETGQADPSRARRAKALGAVSIAVVAIACLAYARPSLQPPSQPALPAAPGFRLDAVDFVDPLTGWVLAGVNESEFAVVATVDGGRHWAPRLIESSLRQGEYMRFFDRLNGVVVTVGGEPVAFTTRDGGASWSRHVVFDVNSYAISATFADPLHGWVLMDPGDGVPLSATTLVRTVDGGETWTRLGETVTTLAQPFAITFSDAQHGWLDAVAPAPEAYATSDGGASWHAVPLPAPKGGWPVPHGAYFVAVRATAAGGLFASVVNSAYANGRNASGTTVLSYPPLTVRTFDGGSPVVYVYRTLADSPAEAVAGANQAGPEAQIPPADQVVMRSIDGGRSWTVVAPPASGGSLGFAGPLDWWWIGPGAVSTTSDGGLTWSPVRPGELSQPVPGSLVVLDSDHAWMSAMVKGSAFLFATSDGGVHWRLVKPPSITP